MKRMKKIAVLGLALALCAGMLAGCSGPTATPTPVATPTPTPEPAFTTANTGYLTMGTNAQFPPYEFYDGKNITGIDAEIAGAIAAKLGLELKIEDMEFDAVNIAVQEGKIDMGLAGMTVTDERLETVDFTESYATGVQVIIVRADNETIAGTNEDLQFIGADGSLLEGTVIGVQRNTTGDQYCTWYMEEEGLATMDRYSRGADAVMALKTGKVDCVVIDNEPAKAFVAENEGLKILEAEYVIEDYAASMSKDNKALYEAVNGALKELIADGTVQTIIDKYITAE